MSALLLQLSALFLFASCCLAEGRTPSELVKALKHGAPAKVSIRVTTTDGTVASNVAVRAGFWNPGKAGRLSEGTTDTNGIFVAEGKTTGEVTISLRKAGHYRTGSKIWLGSGEEPLFVDGRWQPWNSTNTIILKEIRNPVGMHARNVDTTIPVLGTPLAFDLEKGDWVVPHGGGSSADIFITYTNSVQDPWTFSKALSFSSTTRMDGFFIARKDLWSDLHSSYEAPVDGYAPVVQFENERTKYERLKSEDLESAEYVVFRVRTVIDEGGNILSAKYGKIYGPLDYGLKRKGQHRLRFTYYFNPDGTRNLEYDPGKNLLPPLYRGDHVPLP